MSLFIIIIIISYFIVCTVVVCVLYYKEIRSFILAFFVQFLFVLYVRLCVIDLFWLKTGWILVALFALVITDSQVFLYLAMQFLLHLPLAVQPGVGFGMSKNVVLFFPVCHSPSSHSQHLKSSFYFFPSFPGSSPSSRPFQFVSEDLFRHPILLHSLQVT